jgi:23S rRNA (cytosine1962-C5)-methyltransferase
MGDRSYPKAIITKKGEYAAQAGHPWVYGEEIMSVNPQPQDGDLTDVYTQKNKWIGTGFYNSNSKIRIRIISRNSNDKFDDDFWRRRLQYAWNYRKAVMRDEDLECCRIIFGESDQFPGLTVDRFGNILVAEVLCLGIDRIKGKLFKLLLDILKQDNETVDGIYERNDSSLRLKEGLKEYKGWYESDIISHPDQRLSRISENGIKYDVDFIDGQKTGYFLDQKYNRLAVSALSKGKYVLDCFTHTGSFALNAVKGGAEHVTAVDISDSAISMARNNAVINGFEDKMDFITEDIFELLPKLDNGKKIYDFIILDPPAFTKSRKTVEGAMTGYKEINYRAMKLLPRGGFLATCSCSHFAVEERFREMLLSAAHDASVQLRQIEFRQQACDHPILLNVNETNYLKFYLFQVV